MIDVLFEESNDGSQLNNHDKRMINHAINNNILGKSRCIKSKTKTIWVNKVDKLNLEYYDVTLHDLKDFYHVIIKTTRGRLAQFTIIKGLNK